MQGTNFVFCGGAFSGTPCLRGVSLQSIIPSPRNLFTPNPVRDPLAPSSLGRRANEDICSSSSLAAVNFGSDISKIRSPISIGHRILEMPRTTTSTSIFLSGVPLKKIGRSKFPRTYVKTFLVDGNKHAGFPTTFPVCCAAWREELFRRAWGSAWTATEGGRKRKGCRLSKVIGPAIKNYTR